MFYCRSEPNEIKMEIKQEPTPADHEDISNLQCSEILPGPSNEVRCKNERSSSNSFENEPQPGTSGIRNLPKLASPKRNRSVASSDEDSSDDEHVRWRSYAKNTSKTRPRIEQYSQTGTDSTNVGSESRPGQTENNSMDFLSAPDLQLDWLSDSSDEPNDKSIRNVPSPTPIHTGRIKIERQTPIQQVDLTRDTDEEDYAHVPLANISRLAVCRQLSHRRFFFLFIS